MWPNYIYIGILALLVSSPGFAQGVALSLSSASGTPGGTANVNVALSTTGTAPASLQWTLLYSTTDFTSATVTVGGAGTAAGKQVNCNNTAGSSVCVLSGLNANTISNGVVATVAFTISASTGHTSSSLQLSNGVAASATASGLTTSTTGNTVSILQTTWSISGVISPLAGGSGATVTLSGAANATTTADASGNYSFSGLANGTYTVTPSASGYTFTPPWQGVSISGANIGSVNFTATPVATWSISGKITPTASGSGATVTLGGVGNSTTTTDSTGKYTFTGLGNGAYTVTPGNYGYTFSPSSKAVTVNGANVSSVNFTATAVLTTASPVSISPSAGSGSTQSFTATFYDPNGYADLAVVNLLINDFLDGTGACYVAFAPSSATSGSLYLVDDAGDGGYAGGSPMSLPSSTTLHNSQCTISGTGSSLSASGNTLTLTLAVTFASGFGGNKIVYSAARSNTQNSGWQPLGTWSVPVSAPAGPAVGGVTPAHSATSGQTYAFTFTDTNGFGDLAVVDVLVNNFLDGMGACFVAFVPTSANSGQLYLVDDAGDGGYASGSPMALPSSGTLQNSQCTISGTGSSVVASGNTLTLNLAIAFKSGFAGNQVFYMAARNSSTGNTGWQAVGSVTVP